MNNNNLEFPWNGNPLVEDIYEKNNFKIIRTKCKEKNAIVFFSSNGLYSPNTEDEFIEKVVKQDYYDWENVSKNRVIQNFFSKIIFVRDIYCQWYVTGINKNLNSVNKVIDFLRNELDGFQITTCGSSAGGYMATLVGAVLNAERVITSSGQFVLDAQKGGPWVKRYSIDTNINQYYDLRPIMSNIADNVFYLYPAKCDYDSLQNEYVKEVKLHRFAMDESAHGRTIWGCCWPYVLTMKKTQLIKLSNQYSGLINGKKFYKQVVPVKDRLMMVIFKLKRKMLQIFYK